MYKGLDIIIPVDMDFKGRTTDEVVEEILGQHREFGFTRFMLFGPSKTYRRLGYPSQEVYKKLAYKFKEIKEKVSTYDVELGWQFFLTVKSGTSPEFQSIVKPSGAEHAFANCPLNEAFKKRFASDVALFSKIAKPKFIIFEDDYSLSAAGDCFCDEHLKEFEKRYGYSFSRKELYCILNERTPESAEVIKKWREFSKAVLTEFAHAVRKELDKENPEIPMGSMQSGGDLLDGFSTESICRAMAGDKHTPFSRIQGADYGGIKPRNLPKMLFNSLYCKQHIDNFLHYYEADSYPHNLYFSASCQMIAAMATVFSYGFDGAVFFSRYGAEEDMVYGNAYKRNRKRFDEVYKKAKNSVLKGVELHYDPFWSVFDNKWGKPLWTEALGRFGIPYVTTESQVVFWDETDAKYRSDSEIKTALSKNLFLDGDAAKILNERGYTEFIGVSVGEDLSKKDNLIIDLGTTEDICDDFKGELIGKDMFSAWGYSTTGNGIARELTKTSDKTASVTKLYTGDQKFISDAMTYFENSLGGKVVVMGMTIKGNGSKALFNRRRKTLLQNLISLCCDDFCFVTKAADVFVIENEAKNKTDFKRMLTLINMCADKLEEISLHIPKTIKDLSEICILQSDGSWKSVDYQTTGSIVTLSYELGYCEPMFILMK